MKNLVVFGAGGLGRETMWQLESSLSKRREYNILGFIDDTPELRNKRVNTYPVLGGTEYLLNYKEKLSVVICLGNAHDRKSVYEKLRENSLLSFPTVMADNVICSEYVRFGKGCIIGNSVIITVNISVGDFVVIGNGCIVGHDVEVSDFVTLYPNVKVSGNVRIGSESEVGVGTSIIQKKDVGSNTIIGAGAVVIDNIPSNVTAVGVPAKVIKRRG